MKRTQNIELDQDFEVTGSITKAYVDSKTGERHIVGVASGVEEDRDGERVSKNAIRKMAQKASSGHVKLTCSHQEDWWSTIGKAVSGQHDPETDEFIVDTVLPPEGSDPMADKAWKTANTEKVGFSIGGKLLGAFYELSEVGKKRKVLDNIDLRHLCLTEKPAYQNSFAEAVAKTFDQPEPEDSEFEEMSEEVEKDTTTGGWSSEGGRNSGSDSAGSGNRNAGTRDKKTKRPDTEDEDQEEREDDDDEKTIPDSRHLSCPNCGHEFAADLPVDMTPKKWKEKDDKPDTDSEKSTEAIMDLKKQLDDLKALVAKHIEGEKETEETEVDKTDNETKTAPESAETPEVLKMIAASHAEHDERFERIEKTMGEALTLVGENLKQLREQVGRIPLGRKSTARVLPPSTGHEEVGKTVGDQIGEAGSAKDALKILNEHTYGIR